jgi:hypothetical protein
LKFPRLNRKSITIFEVSLASTGKALHYLKFPRLQPEKRCIILSFPGLTGKALHYFKFPGFNRKSVAIF